MAASSSLTMQDLRAYMDPRVLLNGDIVHRDEPVDDRGNPMILGVGSPLEDQRRVQEAYPLHTFQHRQYAQTIAVDPSVLQGQMSTYAVDWATTTAIPGTFNGTVFDEVIKPEPITNFSKWLEKKYGTK